MLLIKSGTLYDTGEARDLLIDGKTIVKIANDIPAGSCDEVIDARGLIVSPGFVDIHVHFREPGFEYKEDITSGAEAAKKGGYTTVICMANTKPCADNAETLKYVLDTGKKTGINVLSVAAVTQSLEGKALTDMEALAAAGAVGFSDDGMPIMDSELLENAMKAAKRLNLPISLHEEDPCMIGTAGVNEGVIAKKLGLTGAARESEIMPIMRDCELALETGARVHIQHLSCAGSVEAVRLAKRRGAAVTAEVTPQHFSLTEDAVITKGTLAKLNPPFRTELDRQSLIAGLKDGTIDIISTDHAPHSAGEKAKPFAEAPSGVIGLETVLALGITNLVRTKHLSLAELIGKMALAPAKLYGLECGIKVGNKADITIFDANESFIVSDEFLSKSNNSPFIGETLYGVVKYTICGGKTVYRSGISPHRSTMERNLGSMAKILYNKKLSKDFYLLSAECGDAVKSGQFYMLRAWGKYPVLSRPISVYDSDSISVTFLYKVVGEGTEIFSRLNAGDEITLQGPYGNGFPEVAGKIALVGGGVGVAPLYLAAKRLKQNGCEVHCFLGYSEEAILADGYRQVCDSVTIDVGGYITDKIEPQDYDFILTCGPEIMMRALYKKCAGQDSAQKLYASMENRMACGIGACLVCSCKTQNGNRKVCKDGPVFKAAEVFSL